MQRTLLSILVALCAITSFAQTADSLAGTWVPDAATKERDKLTKDAVLTLIKGGKMKLRGYQTVGEGTYTVAKDILTIRLSKRNGQVPKSDSEAVGKGKVEDKGKALLVESGRSENGQPVYWRFVRKA